MPKPPELKLNDPLFAAVMGWLIPGLGHVWQGRFGKGILYFVCITGLFLFGDWMGDASLVYWKRTAEETRYVFFAQALVGLPSLPAMMPDKVRKMLPAPLRGWRAAPTNDELDDMTRRLGNRFDMAITYTMIAGLLNLLAIFDVLWGPAQYEEERRHLAKAAGEPVAAEAAT